MRTTPLVIAFVSLAIAGPALAQSALNTNYSANNGAAMYDHSATNGDAMMRHSNGQRKHALGSMRHPTVGNTANQRVNGG